MKKLDRNKLLKKYRIIQIKVKDEDDIWRAQKRIWGIWMWVWRYSRVGYGNGKIKYERDGIIEKGCKESIKSYVESIVDDKIKEYEEKKEEKIRKRNKRNKKYIVHSLGDFQKLDKKSKFKNALFEEK